MEGAVFPKSGGGMWSHRHSLHRQRPPEERTQGNWRMQLGSWPADASARGDNQEQHRPLVDSVSRPAAKPQLNGALLRLLAAAAAAAAAGSCDLHVTPPPSGRQGDGSMGMGLYMGSWNREWVDRNGLPRRGFQQWGGCTFPGTPRAFLGKGRVFLRPTPCGSIRQLQGVAYGGRHWGVAPWGCGFHSHHSPAVCVRCSPASGAVPGDFPSSLHRRCLPRPPAEGKTLHQSLLRN